VEHESLDQLMTRLRSEYLAEVPARLEELNAAANLWLSGREPSVPLVTLFHRLSGSAGAYGFELVSSVCRLTEQWLATKPHRGAEARGRLKRALDQLRWAFEQGPTGPGISA
jgi:HPt (histidine-containing phosphotransfer) domain-containing protein